MLRERKFREDLFYRLNVITLRLLSLRERREDIPLLADHFLEVAAARHKREKKILPSKAVQILEESSWPGNIRQLKTCANAGHCFIPDVNLPRNCLGRTSVFLLRP